MICCFSSLSITKEDRQSHINIILKKTNQHFVDRLKTFGEWWFYQTSLLFSLVDNTFWLIIGRLIQSNCAHLSIKAPLWDEYLSSDFTLEIQWKMKGWASIQCKVTKGDLWRSFILASSQLIVAFSFQSPWLIIVLKFIQNVDFTTELKQYPKKSYYFKFLFSKIGIWKITCGEYSASYISHINIEKMNSVNCFIVN